MYEIKRDNRLSQALVHSVIDRANLFTNQRMSGLAIRARYTHFKAICDHTFDNSPTDSSYSFLNWWSSKHGLETLYNCFVFLFASSQYLSTHLWARPSMSWDHATVLAWGLSHPGNFSVAAENHDSNSFLYSSMMISFGLHSCGACPTT